MKDREFEFVVQRGSTDEFTFAVVSGKVSKKFIAEHRHQSADSAVLQMIRRAVTQWVKETDAGRAAWDGSVRDFNIGDLMGYLDVDEELDDLLKQAGFEELNIEGSSNEIVSSHWVYDSILVNELDLEDQE